MVTKPLLVLLTLLLITTPPPSDSLSFTIDQTLFSLAHSFAIRVANLRASRGDLAGSGRARQIAQKIGHGRGLGLWGVMWSMGWGYVKDSAWRDTASIELRGAASDLNELGRSISELTRVDSEVDRLEWLKRNYEDVLRVSKSLFGRLIKVFSRPGRLREVVEMVQKEVVDGDLLRDCLELGSNDLKGLVQILKDVASQFSSTTSGTTDL